MSARALAATWPAHRDDIADLVTRRPVPAAGLAQVDPFLFLNHHGPQTYPPGNTGLPFGPHPHRGFETVTFIVEGSLAHSDTGGHESVIEAGGVQWMTAGSGLVHAELSPDAFQRDGGPLEILQLWVNLPSRLKMTRPRYRGLQRDELPVVALGDGAGAQLVSGELGGVAGPIASLTGLTMATVALAPGARVELPAPAGRQVLFYTVRGAVTASGRPVPRWHLATFAPDGDTIPVESAEGALILFGHGDPIAEPVVAHGPFVMTTREEIQQAVRDYQAGLFHRATATS
jgi:quercetin 2,3-dioxygenase